MILLFLLLKTLQPTGNEEKFKLFNMTFERPDASELRLNTLTTKLEKNPLSIKILAPCVENYFLVSTMISNSVCVCGVAFFCFFLVPIRLTFSRAGTKSFCSQLFNTWASQVVQQ